MINNFNDLREEFMKNPNRPYWALYYGFDTKSKTGDNQDNADLQSSYDDLEMSLRSKAKPGIRFLIVQSEKVGRGNASNAVSHKFELPGSANSSNAVSAISGAPSISKLEIASMISEAVEKDRLDREVQDLRAENDALRQGEGVNSILQTVMQYVDPNPLIQAISQKVLFGNMATQVSAIGTHPEQLAAKQTPPVVATQTPETATETDTTTGDDDEMELVLSDSDWEALAIIKSHFGVDFSQTLILLANWVNTNPEQAKQFMNLQKMSSNGQ